MHHFALHCALSYILRSTDFEILTFCSMFQSTFYGMFYIDFPVTALELFVTSMPQMLERHI